MSLLLVQENDKNCQKEGLVTIQPESGYLKCFGYHPNFRGIVSLINKLGDIGGDKSRRMLILVLATVAWLISLSVVNVGYVEEFTMRSIPRTGIVFCALWIVVAVQALHFYQTKTPNSTNKLRRADK